MYSGSKVTLEQVLENRERRANRQREWVNAHPQPLVSFTINMMGEVKRNEISRIAFEKGYQAIIDACHKLNIPVAGLEKYSSNTGTELLLSTGINDPQRVKQAMVRIEDEHPLGRLFDIDVLDATGTALSRDTMGLPRRKCLICENDAKICARSRAHQLSELKEKMSEMIHDCK